MINHLWFLTWCSCNLFDLWTGRVCLDVEVFPGLSRSDALASKWAEPRWCHSSWGTCWLCRNAVKNHIKAENIIRKSANLKLLAKIQWNGEIQFGNLAGVERVSRVSKVLVRASCTDSGRLSCRWCAFHCFRLKRCKAWRCQQNEQIVVSKALVAWFTEEGTSCNHFNPFL